MRPSSDIPGVEARAWFSPSQQTYYVQRWRFNQADGSPLVWVAHEGGVTERTELPEDAFEIGASPTPWAYERACEALHNHASRADNAVGRIERLRQHIMRSLSAPNLPLESLVDLLIARSGGQPLVEPEPVRAPRRPPTFDTALSRLTAIAGSRADPSSTWATVRGAMTVAAAGENSALFREVVELASVVQAPVEESERTPAWLTS
jgi:hypothetical protein